MNLTPEEKLVGRDNYYEALGVTRRDFLESILAAGAVPGAGLGGLYFGYSKVDNPVRVGVIGTGDEGNVLIGAMNPDYIQVTAIADIRPSSIHRAFHGDWSSPAAIAARPGLMNVYGWKSEDEARRNVKVYTQDNGGYHELINDPDVEAVVIALPLHLHAPASIEAMMAGKHVLTEKLMAHNVAQCKIMGRVARDQGLYLATGHQRHYSILYDNAVHMIRDGLLGQIHHIRAQWHRGNLPGRDSWAQPLPGGERTIDGKVINPIASKLADFKKALERPEKDPETAALLRKRIDQWTAWDADKTVQAVDHGYEDRTMPDGRLRTALEELVRWRLWNRTGGGLMAELGSHQLDAASIFISSLREDGKKAHPLTVHAVGGRHIFPMDRDAEDHVYCTFEFPGPAYDPDFEFGYRDPVTNTPDPQKGVPSFERDPNKRVVVTYSSINGNGFGGYGEVVMGTKGTLVLEREKEVMLYKDSDTQSRVSVKKDGGASVLDTQSSGQMAGPVSKAAESMGPVSRGYTEELEHWAWCIRNAAPENQPRCNPKVALGDAIIALGANVAISRAQMGLGGYLEFQENWFDIDRDEIPSEVDENGKPKVNFKQQYDRLMKAAKTV